MRRMTRSRGIAIMRGPTPTLNEGECAVDAFERITKEGVDRLAVPDAADRLVGIISKTDLVRAVQVKMIGMTYPNRQGISRVGT